MNLFQNASAQVGTLVELSKKNWTLTFSIVAAIWIVHILNVLVRYRLNYLGILPRHVVGLRGIIFSPFLHGNFEHLLFNTIPLLILINLTLMYGLHTFIFVSLIVIICSGLAVWSLGRHSIHIGASGVIMGYWGYLLAQAYYHPSIMVFIIAGVCIYYLGGLMTSILPSVNKEISWEAHLFGCGAGIFAAFLQHEFDLTSVFLMFDHFFS